METTKKSQDNLSENNKGRFYIYALIHPKTKKIRYIGKTSGKLLTRLNGHITKSKKFQNSPVKKWIFKLIQNKLRPEIILIEECFDTDWKAKERFWIRKYKETLLLLNIYDGGNGANNYKTDLLNQIIDFLGKESDMSLSKRFNVSRETITYHRNKLDIPPMERDNTHNFDHLKGKPAHNKIDFPTAIIENFGKISDMELAKTSGCSCGAIGMARNKLGIPPCPQKHYSGKEHSMYGRRHSKISKKRMSEKLSGENNARSKLNKYDVLEIRKLYSAGKRICEIMKLYPKVTRGAIDSVVKNRSWRSV